MVYGHRHQRLEETQHGGVRQVLREQFMEKTAEYYRRQSDNFLAHHSVVDYMVRCESRLAEEILRSSNYLEERSRRHLLDTLHNVLIRDHAQGHVRPVLALVGAEGDPSILRMYKLLSKVPSTLQALADNGRPTSKQKPKALEELKASAEASEPTTNPRRGQRCHNPKAYMHALILLHSKFNDVVCGAFKKDPLFIKALDAAMPLSCQRQRHCHSYTSRFQQDPGAFGSVRRRILKATSKEETDVANMTADNLVLVLEVR